MDKLWDDLDEYLAEMRNDIEFLVHYNKAQMRHFRRRVKKLDGQISSTPSGVGIAGNPDSFTR